MWLENFWKYRFLKPPSLLKKYTHFFWDLYHFLSYIIDIDDDDDNNNIDNDDDDDEEGMASGYLWSDRRLLILFHFYWN